MLAFHFGHWSRKALLLKWIIEDISAANECGCLSNSASSLQFLGHPLLALMWHGATYEDEAALGFMGVLASSDDSMWLGAWFRRCKSSTRDPTIAVFHRGSSKCFAKSDLA